MGYEQLSSRKVLTRKEHRCPGCSIKYPLGTEMQKTVGKMDGDFQSTYWCMPCNLFLADKWQECDGEIEDGDCWEYPEYREFREQVNNKTNK